MSFLNDNSTPNTNTKQEVFYQPGSIPTNLNTPNFCFVQRDIIQVSLDELINEGKCDYVTK